MARNIQNKAKNIICKICNTEVSLYGMTGHIRHKHRISELTYIEKFGDYRKIVVEPGTKSDKLQCAICNGIYTNKGMATHLRDAHQMTPAEYIFNGNPEYRKNKLGHAKMLDKVGNKFKCIICNECCRSDYSLTEHIIDKHQISKLEYVKKFVFNDIIPICKCGCGESLTIKETYPYCNSIILGHGLKGELNGMFGRIHTKETSKKMSKKAIERINTGIITKDTVPELKFKNVLDKLNIKYRTQEITDFGKVDFYLPDFDLYVEVDGEYWHPTKLEFLNVQLLESAINQKKKSYLNNLVRIRENDIDKILEISDLYRLNYQYNFDITYYQTIISKEYFKQYTGDYADLVRSMSNFINYYQPDFPSIPTNETIDYIINFIKKYDTSKLITNNTFRNNCSNIGVSFLKSNFKSYWNTSYKDSKTPTEAWQDERIRRQIFKYRVGDNDTGEVFDFSLHQVVRGLSALRYTVSFFKPLVAATIYSYFLGDQNEPIVFDPCCGFGGRLLGFKSKYPNGTYIGCEPNYETYIELCKLASNFEKVKIYNCKIEDFDMTELPPNVNLTFTSIPYYDTEIYSNSIKYLNFKHWVDTFINKLKQCPKLIVNIPENYYNIFETKNNVIYYLQNNTSHFNKKTNTKHELILKLYV